MDQSDLKVAESNYVKTHKGEALTDEGCDSLMTNVQAKLIMLAGLKDSGKSTLIGSFMQLFQDSESFAGHKFAGSETLIGFEKICHESRMTSGRSMPHTARTVKGFDGILHLKVKANIPDSRKFDLLFTNLSGEDFDLLAKSTDACKKFTMAKRADHFALFIDSDLLSEKETRQSTKVNSVNVLTSLLDADMISSKCKIDIIFSKWDLLLEKNNIEDHRKFTDQIKEDLKKRIEPFKLELNFFEIASRPNRLDVLSFGHGLESLFSNWTRMEPQTLFYLSKNKLTNIPHREFTKYSVG
jgi:GTPase SAR1 family protein